MSVKGSFLFCTTLALRILPFYCQASRLGLGYLVTMSPELPPDPIFMTDVDLRRLQSRIGMLRPDVCEAQYRISHLSDSNGCPVGCLQIYFANLYKFIF